MIGDDSSTINFNVSIKFHIKKLFAYSLLPFFLVFFFVVSYFVTCPIITYRSPSFTILRCEYYSLVRTFRFMIASEIRLFFGIVVLFNGNVPINFSSGHLSTFSREKNTSHMSDFRQLATIDGRSPHNSFARQLSKFRKICHFHEWISIGAFTYWI